MLVYLQDHDIRELGSEPRSRVDWPQFWRASFVRNTYGLLRRASHPLIPKALPDHGWYRDQSGVLRQLFYYNYAALPFADYEQERFETTKATFREGLELSRAQGVSMVLVFVPMKFRVYASSARSPQTARVETGSPEISQTDSQHSAPTNASSA